MRTVLAVVFLAIVDVGLTPGTGKTGRTLADLLALGGVELTAAAVFALIGSTGVDFFFAIFARPTLGTAALVPAPNVGTSAVILNSS